MDTPIVDFVRGYAQSGTSRLHMPGHKGQSLLGFEPLDLTEIRGADELYEPEGIIAQSEANATRLFGTQHTYYSTEGSSQCIRAMLCLALQAAPRTGKRPVLLAARNAHKALLYAAALLDFDIRWLWPAAENAGALCSCPISAQMLTTALQELTGQGSTPFGVYVTSPDYLGGMQDIRALSAVCDTFGVPLLVDNAHGAYLRFLPGEPLHPIALGAAMCCDSAHKTLPVVTGGAYLHLGSKAPVQEEAAVRGALVLFGSTSPSYPVMASLDLCRAWLEEEGQKAFQTLERRVGAVKKLAAAKGLGIPEGLTDPVRITLNTAKIGLTGQKAAQGFRECGVEPEYADDGFVVLIPSPFNTEEEFLRVERAIESMPVGAPLAIGRRIPPVSGQAVSPRKAVLSPSEEVPMNLAVGRIAARASCPCPPGVPVVMPGEVISEKAAEFLIRYGFSSAKVLK